MPYSVYEQIGLRELKPTQVALQLADRSVRVPRGIIEDVLVKVDKFFFFPVDFIVLDIAPVQNSRKQTHVILGRPFLTMTNANINCHTGVMDLSFGNMKVWLNASRASHQPLDKDDCFAVDVVDELMVKALQPKDTLPVIIALDLSKDQEGQILDVLKKHKSAINWSIADLQGIDPSIYIRRIHCKDDSQHSRGMQRHLIPNMIGVDMKEALSHVFLQVRIVLHRFSLLLFFLLAANILQVL